MSDSFCPSCKFSSKKIIYQSKKFSLLMCSSCGLGYLTPMPTKLQISKLYQKAYFQQKGSFLSLSSDLIN